MKNIFKFFGTILTVVLASFSLTGCVAEDELGSADLGLHVKVFFPTKVVAGQPMTINGSGFAEATEIVFPGEVVVTDFQIVSNDMIRVNAPKGIAAEGGKIVVRTAEDQAESPLPLTLGETKISGYSVEAGAEVEGGSQITVYGTDLEFVTKVEVMDEEGNPLFIEDKLFNKKATATIIFTLPKKVYEGKYVAKIHTVDGKVFDSPEYSFKPGSDGGYWEPVEHVIWENPDPAGIGSISWSGQYRFHGEGTADDNAECLATIAAADWEIIKTGTFYLKAQADGDVQMRITDGWWSTTWTGNDIMGGDERIIDNGDGTFFIEISLAGDPLVDVLDSQHFLLTGSGYTPLKLYTVEEVWVPGGSVEIVRTSIWKNDGSVGAATWSGSPYRFGMEGMDGNNECVATIAPEIWEKMKTTPFNVQIQPAADWWQIRMLDGWWSIGNDEANDISPNTPDKLVDNGDGTYTFVVDLQNYPNPDTPLVSVVDAQHLLFAGDGFIILEMFWEEEVVIPGGGGAPAETVVWENDGSFDFVSWGGHFRFGLEGMDTNNECAATFPQDVWDRLKSGPFKLLVTIKPDATWWQIRVMDGWWSVGNDQSGASDLTVNTEGVVDNGDGTFVIPVDISGNADLLAVVDAQHILFSGDAYRIDKIYYE